MLAVYLQNGRVTVEQRPKPQPRPGHALIKLVCAGICNTDLELQRGYYGFSGVPGHEFVGEVVTSPEPKLLGRRVVGEINLDCGRCEWCRRGLGRHCPHRTTLGIVKHPGVFAEYFTLPVRNLFVVPDQVLTDAAVFTEPLAAACEILEQVRIPKGDRVAVLGGGKLGLLIVQVLKAHGCQVRLFHRDDAKTGLYRWVVEATGTADGLRQAVAITEPRGTLILKSTVHGEVPLDTAALVVNEITLVGSRCGRFAPALRLLRQGKIQTAGMISARYPLAGAPAAFEKAAQRGVRKVLLVP
jgi:threonine dehydrogenase-like Zn-dependent dehydrogenase